VKKLKKVNEKLGTLALKFALFERCIKLQR
jgi:hypothetical protein